MAEQTIIDIANLDLTKIKYGEPKAGQSNSKTVGILYKYFDKDTNKLELTGLKVEMPVLLTWGATDYVDSTGKSNGKYTASLQFPSGEYATPETTAALNSFKALDVQIRKDILENQKKWLNKTNVKEDVLNAIMNPWLHYPKLDKESDDRDYTKSPTLRIQLPQWENVWKFSIFDEDGNTLYSPNNPANDPRDLLKKGTNFSSIIQFGGINIIAGRISITWKLLQAVVKKPKALLTPEKCYIKVDKSKFAKLPEPPVDHGDSDILRTPTKKIVENTIQDSDDDVSVHEDLHEEEIPIIKPPVVEEVKVSEPVVEEAEKPKVKKVIKKKV